MIVIFVAEAAHDGGAVGSGRQHGQVFAVNNARQAGFHHAELATHFQGAIGFGVEGVDVAGGTGLKNQNDRLGPRTV